MDPIWLKTKCSLFEIQLMLFITFGCDQSAGLKDILVWNCLQMKGCTDARTDAGSTPILLAHHVSLRLFFFFFFFFFKLLRWMRWYDRKRDNDSLMDWWWYQIGILFRLKWAKKTKRKQICALGRDWTHGPQKGGGGRDLTQHPLRLEIFVFNFHQVINLSSSTSCSSFKPLALITVQIYYLQISSAFFQRSIIPQG